MLFLTLTERTSITRLGEEIYTELGGNIFLQYSRRDNIKKNGHDDKCMYRKQNTKKRTEDLSVMIELYPPPPQVEKVRLT